VRPSPDRNSKDATPSNHGGAKRDLLAAPVKAVSADLAFEWSNTDAAEALKSETSGGGEILQDQIDEEEDTDVRNNAPSRIPTATENFTLSRNRLRKSDILYSDEQMLCVRLKEKTVRLEISAHVAICDLTYI
jgi:polynucleotide 5'-hydroxyl-kinase GRC3/NOL9